MERADLGPGAWVRAEGTDSPKSNVQGRVGRDTNPPHPCPLPSAKRTGEGEKKSAARIGAARRDEDPRRGGDPFFTQREKKIPGRAGTSCPAGTGPSQLR